MELAVLYEMSYKIRVKRVNMVILYESSYKNLRWLWNADIFV